MLEFTHYYLRTVKPRHETLQHFAINHSNFLLFCSSLKTKESKNGTIMKLFLLRIRTTNTEMLNREKIMFETSSTADSHYSSCDCNDNIILVTG